MKSIFIIIFGVFVTTNLFANKLEKPPKKWPCDQVYNSQLDLKALWQGPDIKNNLKNWWKDDEIIQVVNKLSDPILSEDEGLIIIEDFAKKHTFFGLVAKKEQKDKLLNLFSGLYQKASEKRIRQYKGIIKFVERQDIIRDTIGESSKKLRELKKKGFGKDHPEVINFASQMEWNTKVFDRRTTLTEFMCEEPVYLEQRIGYQARKILSFLEN
tara:strand:+ start:1649 stop:2287 length:639 start_codon:yes stop_codon:yes gene_type:complete